MCRELSQSPDLKGDSVQERVLREEVKLLPACLLTYFSCALFLQHPPNAR